MATNTHPDQQENGRADRAQPRLKDRTKAVAGDLDHNLIEGKYRGESNKGRRAKPVDAALFIHAPKERAVGSQVKYPWRPGLAVLVPTPH